MAVRRVRRIVRRIDPWTVLKVSLVFNAIAALIFVLGTWVTWSLALRRGIPERVVDIFESLTLTITIEGELYFRIVVLLAIIGAILATAFMTLGAVLYNLIADVVGGVEVAVLEETYRPAATRTRMKPVAEQQAAGTPRWSEPVTGTGGSPARTRTPPEEAPIETPAARLIGTGAAARGPRSDRDASAPETGGDETGGDDRGHDGGDPQRADRSSAEDDSPRVRTG